MKYLNIRQQFHKYKVVASVLLFVGYTKKTSLRQHCTGERARTCCCCTDRAIKSLCYFKDTRLLYSDTAVFFVAVLGEVAPRFVLSHTTGTYAIPKSTPAAPVVALLLCAAVCLFSYQDNNAILLRRCHCCPCACSFATAAAAVVVANRRRRTLCCMIAS